MLPTIWSEEVFDVQRALSTGLIVVFQLAMNPGAVMLLSLVNSKYMLPDDAM
jgi:hypothetical protein